jgi:glycerophosphoryl diester phosphodiesterase
MAATTLLNSDRGGTGRRGPLTSPPHARPAVERLPESGHTRYDGRYEVPTCDEVLDLVRRESRRRGEAIGVYPETKHRR